MRAPSPSRLAGPVALLVSRYAVNVIGPLVALLVVRYLGPERYGLYASAAAVTSLFGVLSDFGLQQAGLEMATGMGASLPAVTRGIIRVGALYTLVAYGAVALWLIVGDYDREIVWLGLLLGLGFFQTPLLTSVTVALQTKGRYARLAMWNLLASATTWVGTLVAILVDAGLYGVVGWPVVAGWIRTGLMLLAERRLLGLGNCTLSDMGLMSDRRLLGRSCKFGASGVAHSVYHRSDAALLSVMRDPLEVGQYMLAFRIIELLNAFPGVVFNQVLYPKYFGWFSKAPQRVSLYYGLTFKVMAVVGVMAATALSLWGGNVIAALFGDGYRLSAELLVIMVWSVPARFLAAASGALLTTGGEIDRKIRAQGIIAVINVGLNLALIPFFGAHASAAVLVLTDSLLLTAYSAIVYVRQRVSPLVGKRDAVALGLLAASCIGLAGLGMGGTAMTRVVATTLAIGTCVGYALTGVDPEEKAELRRLVGHPAAMPWRRTV